MNKIFTIVFFLLQFFVFWITWTEGKCQTQPTNLIKAFDTVFGDKIYYRKCNDTKVCSSLLTESWILKSTGNVTVKDCKGQFPANYWGCEVGSKVRDLFQKVYRESAYLAALTGAELMKVVIMGCTAKFLEPDCNKKSPDCNDDIDYAKKFVFDFFKLKDEGADRRIKRFILKHNIKIGVKTFEKNVDEICRIERPPFRRICCGVPKPFSEVISQLYAYYKSAYKYTKKLRQSWNRPTVKARKGLKNKYLVYMHEKEKSRKPESEKKDGCVCEKG